MTKVVNLTRARKLRARTAEKAQAAENRVAFGRTKAERAQSEAVRLAEARRLDGLKREPES